MKQHITVEQLQELTDEQKVNLQKRWNPALGHLVLNQHIEEDVLHLDGEYGLISYGSYMDTMGSMEHVKENCFPLLSIGQMIELADCVGINRRPAGWGIDEWTNLHEELADALWEQVKAIL